MDGSRFDALTRSLARRGLLKGLAAAAAALATGARAADASVPRCGSDADCGAIAGARCLKGGCRCPHPQIDCAGVCVDLHESDANCGRCGQACGDGQICSGSRCRCANLRQTLCAGTCVDTRGDKHNCGTCGHRCPVGNTQGCVDGVCQACPHGQVVCPGQPGCHDLLRDPNNCNGCGATCENGQTCVDGACQCPAGQTLCAGRGRVDLRTNDDYCGSCATHCKTGAGEVCRAGQCVCADPTLSQCPDGCVDLQTNAAHCGACATACATSFGELCRGGACVCADPTLTHCPHECTNVQVDPRNCGACGHVCQPGEGCRRGGCACQDPASTQCPDGCFVLDTDPANCGACGHACPAGGACVNGVCPCPSGQRLCGDGCCPDGQKLCCQHVCCAAGAACDGAGGACGSACGSGPWALVVSGGADPAQGISVDDNFTLTLDGQTIAEDFGPAGTRPPVGLSAGNGAVIRVLARDTYGYAHGIGPLSLHRTCDGATQALDAVGFPWVTDHAPGSNTPFYDKRFTVAF